MSSPSPSELSLHVQQQQPIVTHDVDEAGLLTATVNFGDKEYTVTIKMLSGEKKIEKDSDLNKTILKIIKEIKLEEYEQLSGTTTRINLDPSKETQVKYLKEKKFIPLSDLKDTQLKETIKTITEVFRKHFPQHNPVIQKQQPVNQDELKKKIKSDLEKLEKNFNKEQKYDLKLVESCADDIEMLENYSKKNDNVKKDNKLLSKISSFRKHLNEIAGRMIDATESVPSNFLMGDETELRTVAEHYSSDSVVRNGLMRLDSKYRTRRIKGDGHCQFRSIAAALLYLLEKGKPLDKKVKKGDFQKADEVTQIINDVIKGSNTVEETMRNPEKSNLFVEYLRWMACEYNRKHQTGVFKSMAISLSKSPDKYLKDMANMDPPEWGGEPELIALSKALKIHIHVLDVRQIGKEQKLNDTNMHFNKGKDKPQITLLLRLQHYDVAIKK